LRLVVNEDAGGATWLGEPTGYLINKDTPVYGMLMQLMSCLLS